LSNASNDGEQGVKIATREISELIVTDVIMPRTDGFQLIRKIRNDVRTSHIPIILLTSSDKEEHVSKDTVKAQVNTYQAL
jgi:CheY-like chemotaxis protein